MVFGIGLSFIRWKFIALLDIRFLANNSSTAVQKNVKYNLLF